MTVRLRTEQCCRSTGCTRPARHADLCSPCYRAASAVVRATCDWIDRLKPEYAARLEVRWLEELWAA